MSKKQKKMLIRIIIALILFLTVFIIDKIVELAGLIDNKYGWILPFGLYFIIYLYIGYDVLKEAFLHIFSGSFLDENFLMCVATIGAFSLGIYCGITGREIEGFDEGCAVLLFYQVGEFFQSYAVGRSRKSITKLMDIRPDIANKINPDGSIETLSPDMVSLNDIILVKPGEKIPLDGIVVKGETSIDTKALTGESMPRDVIVGDEVISGCLNLSSAIEVKVLKEFYDSTVSKILDLVENASNNKSNTESFITKFARFYTPIVVILAIMLGIIPSIITRNPSTWIYRALCFLVVSCPCALVISVPLSFFAGIGAASRYKILIKGSNYLEAYKNAEIFVFDKTGTLTKGVFKVNEIISNDKEKTLMYAAIAEANSNHPIARSIVSAYNKEPNKSDIKDIPGYGIVSKYGNDTIYCGNVKLMNKYNISFDLVESDNTIVYVALNEKYLGAILISDEIKPEAKEVISDLNKKGKTIMLTGDHDRIAKNVSSTLGLSEYRANMLPQDKLFALEKIISENPGKMVAYVGDGINDAPVLMRSDIGIAMGGVGSDAAIEASDIVLMEDDLKEILKAKKIAKKTMKIVYENIIFAIGVKVLILILAALGFANMWLAVFGDVGVAVIAILNALRVNSKYE